MQEPHDPWRGLARAREDLKRALLDTWPVRMAERIVEWLARHLAR